MSNSNGRIIRVQGPVVDVYFETSTPQVYEALIIDLGKNNQLVLETALLIGDKEVKSLAMGPTDGLRRGMQVKRTFSPIKVPLGSKTLGRIFNVL